LSPYLFLLVVEGLSSALHRARRNRLLNEIQMRRGVSLTQLLFVDVIFLFGFGFVRESQTLNDILDLYITATKMEINLEILHYIAMG